VCRRPPGAMNSGQDAWRDPLTDLIRGVAEPLQNTRIAAGGSNP
jgi:hypothetical protein